MGVQQRRGMVTVQMVDKEIGEYTVGGSKQVRFLIPLAAVQTAEFEGFDFPPSSSNDDDSVEREREKRCLCNYKLDPV